MTFCSFTHLSFPSFVSIHLRASVLFRARTTRLRISRYAPLKSSQPTRSQRAASWPPSQGHTRSWQDWATRTLVCRQQNEYRMSWRTQNNTVSCLKRYTCRIMYTCIHVLTLHVQMPQGLAVSLFWSVLASWLRRETAAEVIFNSSYLHLIQSCNFKK